MKNVGNVSVLLEGVNGSFMAQSNSPDELADLAYAALSNKKRSEGRKAIIEKKLDIESVTKQLVTLYKSL